MFKHVHAKPRSQNLVFLLLSVVISAWAAADLYVAPDGDDNNPGTEAEPLKTLEVARDRVRQIKFSGLLSLGPFNVFLREGTYYRSATFQLDSGDSGTPASPIIYRSYPGESVSITGGKEFPSEWFSLVGPESPVWDRLDPSAQGVLLQCDLAAHGFSDYGSLLKRGYGVHSRAAMELFLGDVPLQLARWPNDDFEQIDTIPDGRYGHTFTYTGNRPSRWLLAEDPWAFGYWFYGWADTYTGISDINTTTKTITLTEDVAYGLKEGARYYVLNLLEEIDSPGEWYMNRDTGILYLWPPAGFGTQKLFGSMGKNLLVRCDDLAHVFFRDITFEMSRSGLFRIDNGDHIVLSHCTFRNAGIHAIDLTGNDCTIDRCAIYNCGDEGIILKGGNLYTLQPSNITVKNCRIHHVARWCRTYRPCIQVKCVGADIIHNEFSNCPHSAIINDSNDNLFAYNRFHDICSETDDAGAYYAGRDWGSRGNVLKYNLFYDILGPDVGDNGVQAVYLDDCDSGTTIYGNIFYNVSNRAMMIGGGRDNIIENNVIVDCYAAFYIDRRGTFAINETPGDSWNLLEKIQKYNYTEPPWSTAYPRLAAILDQGYEQAKEPEGNEINKNLFWLCLRIYQDGCWGGCGGFDFFDITNNLFADPMFIDEYHHNFALDPASPAYSIPGFQPIPYKKIKILSPSDINEDGGVDILDLALLVDHWLTNPNPATPAFSFSPYDLNWDCQCNLLDAAFLNEDWLIHTFQWTTTSHEELNTDTLTAEAPYLSADKLTLYYGRRNSDWSYEEIAVATRTSDKGAFTLDHILTELGDHANSPWLSPDGQRLYYTEVLPADGKRWLRMAVWNSGTSQWDPTTTFSGIHVSGYNDAGSTLTADELTLFFHSVRPGGQGASDIWKATRASIGDPFSTPVNVTELNSSRYEAHPSVSPDGLTIYFTGNMDTFWNPNIYKATRASTSDPFSNITPVPNLSETDVQEDTPYVSSDEKTFLYGKDYQTLMEYSYISVSTE